MNINRAQSEKGGGAEKPRMPYHYAPDVMAWSCPLKSSTTPHRCRTPLQHSFHFHSFVNVCTSSAKMKVLSPLQGVRYETGWESTTTKTKTSRTTPRVSSTTSMGSGGTPPKLSTHLLPGKPIKMTVFYVFYVKRSPALTLPTKPSSTSEQKTTYAPTEVGLTI